jgi:hypothetical protein
MELRRDSSRDRLLLLCCIEKQEKMDWNSIENVARNMFDNSKRRPKSYNESWEDAAYYTRRHYRKKARELIKNGEFNKDNLYLGTSNIS